MDQSPLLSPVARAILSGMKNIPNYAAQAAQTGLASLEDALQLKTIADKVSQSGQALGPAIGNVVDDLKMKVQMALSGQSVAPSMPQGAPQGMPPQGAPQGAMPPQGMPPQGAMPPQQPPMDPRMAAGIGTLPAPNMTQGMAEGGIVAFQQGGDTYGYDNQASEAGLLGPYADSYIPPIIQERLGARDSDEEEAPSDGLEAMLRASVMDKLSNKPDISLDTFQKESDAEAARLGIGNALEKRIGILAKRAEEEKGLSEKDLKELQKQNKYDTAAAFFKAAASGNKTALGALGEGFGGAAQAKSATAKEERALAREQRRVQQSLEDANLSVAEAQENLRYNRSKEAQQRFDAARAEQRTAQERAENLGVNLAQLDATRSIAQAKAATTKSAAAVYAPQIEELEVKLSQVNTQPERNKILQQMGIVRGRWVKAAAAEAALEPKQQQTVDGKVQDALAEAIKDPQSRLSLAERDINMYSRKSKLTQEEAEKLGAAQKKYKTERQRIEQETRNIYGRVYGEGGMGSENMSVDDLVQMYGTPQWQR